MGKKEVKIDKHLTADDTAGFLRTLADSLLEKPGKDLSYDGIDLQGLKKIKMHLKNEDNNFNLKLKLKYSSSPLGKTSEHREKPVKYKTLKKKFNQTFKALKASITGGHLPDSRSVDSFIEQAEFMVSFKNLGYGDEYYEEFIRLCHEFKKIYETGNMDKLVNAYNNIDARKALCHDKYD